MAVACKCLCTVAARDQGAAAALASRAQVSHSALVHVLQAQASKAEVQTARAFAGRYLFILGE